MITLTVLKLSFLLCIYSSSAYTFDGSYKISPKPCIVDTKSKGICMFVWECIKTEGKHLGMCVDGFMFGSCCGHNASSNFVLDNNSITTTKTTQFPSDSNNESTSPSSTSFSATTFKTTTVSFSSTSSSPSSTPTSFSPGTLTTTWTTPSSLPSSSTVVSTASFTSSPLTSPSTSELQLPFVTGNGSSLPEEHLIGAAASSSPLHIDVKNSSSVNSDSSFSPYSSLSSSTPSSTWGTSTIPSTTSSTATSITTTIQPPTFTSSTSTTKRPSTNPFNNNIFKSTQRPNTIFIDPMSTTTPQPNISQDKHYGCGLSPLYPQMRIVGGKAAMPFQFPWQVSVRRTSFFGFSSTHRCGGALLNENWIATASHCVDDLLTSQIRIRLGEWDFSNTQEKYSHVERSVSKKVVHPSYNFFTYENDLALIKLESPVILTPHINPICLPANDDLLINENATVSGWGRLSEGGQLPSSLQHVTVPILSNSKCRDMFLKSGRVEHIPDIFLCAGYESGGKDSCQGDSGGPLQVKGSDSRWFLAGIISWGIGCAEPSMPGVCTRISRYRQWILKHTAT